MLAVTEANRAGYDEAILLTDDGSVADGSGENIFVVKDGVDRTPPLSTSILPGITRDTVIKMARRSSARSREDSLIRTDLNLADEVFMCGTAAEVTPIRSVDDLDVGVGPVTRQIQKAYLDLVNGRERALGALARAVVDRPRARARDPGRRPADPALRGPGSTSGRKSSSSRCCAPGGCRSGRSIDRFEELFAERVGAPYAAAVSSGTAGLHLLCHIAGTRRRVTR